MDGTSKGLYIDTTTNIQDATSEMTLRLRLKEEFSLCVGVLNKQTAQERKLKGSDIICDLLNQWETAEKKEMSTIHRLFFKKKFFDEPQKQVNDPVAANLLYHQGVHDVVLNLLPVTKEDVVTLGGLQLQVLHGDSSPDNKVLTSTNYLHWHVPLKMLKPWNHSEWIKNLLTAHESNRGKSPEQCKEEYLRILRKIPFYGSSLFFVELPMYDPSNIWMWLNKDGMFLTEEFSNEILQHWTYHQITNWSAPDGVFNINVGNLLKPKLRVFTTSQPEEIAEMYTYFMGLAKHKLARTETVARLPVGRRRAAF